MKTNNIMMALVSGQSSQYSKTKRNEASESRNAPKFDAFLKGSADRNGTAVDSNRDVKRPVNSFRQISKNRAVHLNSQENSTKIADKGYKNEGTDKEAIEAVKEDSVIKGIAGILGISAEDLNQILANMNIKPSELCNSDSSLQAVAKLSEEIGLSFEQQNRLSSVISEISSMVNSVMEDVNRNSAVQNTEGWVIVEGANIEVSNNLKPDFNQISEMIESRLREFIGGLKDTDKVSLSDISLKMKQLVSDMNLQKNLAGALNGQDGFINSNGLKDKKEEEGKGDAETDADIEPLPAVKSQMNDTSKALEAAKFDSENPNANYGAVGETAKNTEILKAARTTGEVRVVKNELMSQIIDKAKVMLDGQKSEMIMELRPESLGKLALKVVTENGIVMAKFVAENQQVKEVIESNMQLLKDTLEEQGLSVKGFSVSVGHESGDGDNLRKYFTPGGKRMQNSRISETDTIPGVFAETNQSSAVNPYEADSSSVDFRA